MTRKEVQELIIKITKNLNTNIETYKDFLDIQEGLIGENNPLITKFRNVIDKFNSDAVSIIKSISYDLQKLYPTK